MVCGFYVRHCESTMLFQILGGFVMCKDLKFARARVPGQPGLQKKGGGKKERKRLLESDFFFTFYHPVCIIN